LADLEWSAANDWREVLSELPKPWFHIRRVHGVCIMRRDAERIGHIAADHPETAFHNAARHPAQGG
jgi:hypothetical protein